jgi:hypothetical protein
MGPRDPAKSACDSESPKILPDGVGGSRSVRARPLGHEASARHGGATIQVDTTGPGLPRRQLTRGPPSAAGPCRGSLRQVAYTCPPARAGPESRFDVPRRQASGVRVPAAAPGRLGVCRLRGRGHGGSRRQLQLGHSRPGRCANLKQEQPGPLRPRRRPGGRQPTVETHSARPAGA